MDKIFIVMEYVEHDLKALMEIMPHPFLQGMNEGKLYTDREVIKGVAISGGERACNSRTAFTEGKVLAVTKNSTISIIS